MEWTNKVYQWSVFDRSWFRGSCALCGERGHHGLDLCHGCRAELPGNTRACRLCAHPLDSAEADTCGHCLQNPPPFTAFAPFLYAQPLDRLIIELKFNGRLYLGRTLGELLAGAVAAESAPLPHLIVPVPLHPARLRERGYNQAAELARPVSKRLAIPVMHAVRRIRATPGQAGLSAKERRRNLRGSFLVDAQDVVRGKRVAVVDDVFTTGATATELAKCLARAGAASICVFTLARTIRPT